MTITFKSFKFKKIGAKLLKRQWEKNAQEVAHGSLIFNKSILDRPTSPLPQSHTGGKFQKLWILHSSFVPPI